MVILLSLQIHCMILELQINKHKLLVQKDVMLYEFYNFNRYNLLI
jgi:hypothetical protein